MPATTQEPTFVADFQHVSITSRDIERSVRFYETIGLKVVKPLFEVEQEGIARAFQLPAARLKVVYLGAPQGAGKMFIDLVQWTEPEATGQAYPALNHVGLNRLAFRVTDLDALTAALRPRGIVFLSEEPQVFGDGIRCIATTDPDGVFIQFIEGL